METDGRPQKKPTSPWVWVGCGCGAIVILGMLGVAGMGWWGMTKGKEFAETMADPEKRAAKVQEVLPYDTLPEGYYPAFSFSMPFGFMDMAVLTDHDPTSEPVPVSRSPRTAGRRSPRRWAGDDLRTATGRKVGGMGSTRTWTSRSGASFTSACGSSGQRREDAPLPAGRGAGAGGLRLGAVQRGVRPKKVVRRGSVNAGGKEILYSTSRGEISRQGRDKEGLVTMVMPECGDKRFRFGLWFTPDPDPQKPVAEVDWAGTGADPAAIQQFLEHFKLCGAGT